MIYRLTRSTIAKPFTRQILTSVLDNSMHAKSQKKSQTPLKMEHPFIVVFVVFPAQELPQLFDRVGISQKPIHEKIKLLNPYTTTSRLTSCSQGSRQVFYSKNSIS